MRVFDNIGYEIFAIVSLLESFPDFIGSPVKGESPDWRDEEKDIGLEVSCAETKHIGYAKAFSNRYLGHNKLDIPEKELLNFKGWTYFEAEKLSSVSAFSGMVDGKLHVYLALAQTKKKLNLLNKNFHLFNKNCLFLFLMASLLDSDTEYYVSEYRKIVPEYDKSFSDIFLFSLDSITHIDVVSNNVDTIDLSLKLPELNDETLSLRAKGDWKNNTRFFDVCLD